MNAKRLMLLFGLVPEEWQRIFKFQKGCCAICGKPLKKANTDHRHSDGLVRGLLDWQCNRALGFFRDSPDLLRRAAEYLERPPAVEALGVARYGRTGRVNKKTRKKKSK